MEAHEIDLTGAWSNTVLVHPADKESVSLVLGAEESTDGRSPWVWVRLPNGDLILGVFPQGETYFAIEDDAAWTT